MKFPDTSYTSKLKGTEWHDKYFTCFCKPCEERRGPIKNFKMKRRVLDEINKRKTRNGAREDYS